MATFDLTGRSLSGDVVLQRDPAAREEARRKFFKQRPLIEGVAQVEE